VAGDGQQVRAGAVEVQRIGDGWKRCAERDCLRAGERGRVEVDVRGTQTLGLQQRVA